MSGPLTDGILVFLSVSKETDLYKTDVDDITPPPAVHH